MPNRSCARSRTELNKNTPLASGAANPAGDHPHGVVQPLHPTAAQHPREFEHAESRCAAELDRHRNHRRIGHPSRPRLGRPPSARAGGPAPHQCGSSELIDYLGGWHAIAHTKPVQRRLQ